MSGPHNSRRGRSAADNTEEMQALAQQLLAMRFEDLPVRDRRVLEKMVRRLKVSSDINRELASAATFGERIADRVAAFGGSWTFIIGFGVALVIWVVLNSVVLIRWGDQFDPYPYIFLKLVLSMLAAIQAPVIMMSQNRQAVRDRLAAGHDYEVNLKAELEIMRLHEKMDDLRGRQIEALLASQQSQIALLTALITQSRDGGRASG
jgi:uncharacterized membrane protein